MPSIPKAEARPQIELYFPDVNGKDWGIKFSKLEFKGMLNGGYIVKVKLFDPHFNLQRILIDSGYLQESRSKTLLMKFKIKWGAGSQPVPEKATDYQSTYVTSLKAYGESSDNAYLEFIGIDIPSWHLNTGDGSGKIYTGNVQGVIKQVVNEYAPDIEVEVSSTLDSKHNKWQMMRMDPKTFIGSLLDWSSSITINKTNWIVIVDGKKLEIKEQADIRSIPRAYYRFWDGEAHDTISKWEFLANNALSIAETKIITQGLSAVSGQYLDRTTDPEETMVFAKDTTTSHKKIAQTKPDQSFSKPDDSPGSDPPKVGWTSISAIPEIYSAGDLGLKYNQYIDGRPRGIFLGLTNGLMRMKLTVVGHGEWSSCKGLGTDTVFIKWMSAASSGKKLWFLSGNWIIYGFQHKVQNGRWLTDLYLSRYDHNSSAEKVGGSII